MKIEIRKYKSETFGVLINGKTVLYGASANQTSLFLSGVESALEAAKVSYEKTGFEILAA
jgi:hypothetical protein